MNFSPAEDIQRRINEIIKRLDFTHMTPQNIVCMRSFDSKSDAYARIWSLPRIWQKAIGVEPHYVIEVLSQRFDKLATPQQDKVLIHELLHIPKTFSGALVPHKCFKKRIDRSTVDFFYNKYINQK